MNEINKIPHGGLKFGIVTEINVKNGTVRVNFTDEGIVSNPLHVSVPASRKDKYSFPFSINENVWCLMDENCEFGVVGGAIYSKKNPPNASFSQNSIDIILDDKKIEIKIDKSLGNFNIKTSGDLNIKTDGKIKIESAKEVEINALNVKVSGNLTVLGAVTASGFSGNSGKPMAVNSDIETSKDIKIQGTSLISHVKNHKHISSNPGNTTSTPIN